MSESDVRAVPSSPKLGRPPRHLAAILLLAVLPLLAFEIFSVVQTRRTREAEIRLEASRLLDLLEAEEQRIIEDIRHMLVFLTELGVGRMDAATCQTVMARIKEQLPGYLAINAANKEGTIWCASEPKALGLTVFDRPYRWEAVKSDEMVGGQYILSRTTGRPAIPFARAYRGADGSSAGSIAVLLDINWLEHYLAQKRLPENAAVLIADKAGTILARVPESPGLSGQPVPEQFRPLLNSTEKGVVDTTGLDGIQRIIAYSPIMAGLPGLYMQVSLDKAEAMRTVNNAVWWSLLLFTAMVLLTGLGVGYSVRWFVRIREQAQQSTLRTAAVLENTADGVIEIDREWRFTFLNERAKTLIAQGRDLIGQKLWDAFPELVDSPLWDKAHRAMVQQQPTDAEFHGTRTGRWFWMRAFPSPRGLSVYLLDITQRRQVENELRESKDRLSLALASAHAGTFDWDLQAGKGHWSEESYRIFGLDPDQNPAGNETWLRIVHPDDVESASLTGQMQYLAEQKPGFQLEYRVLHPDGSVRWVSSIGCIRYADDGTPLQFSGLNIDISERRAMEEALRQSEERLSIALAAANAAVWDVDVRSGHVTWSDGVYRLFGLDPATFAPSEQAFFDLVHPDDKEALRRQFQDIYRTGCSDYGMEYRIVHPSAGARWIMSVGRVEYDQRGRPVRLNGLSLDITERKAIEEALRKAKADADEANVSKSKFLAAASHDLRQPLQSALLFAGVLQRYVPDEKGRGPLMSLERALDTLKNLLDSLLDVSRLDAGVIVPQATDMPLSPLLEEIAAAYAPVAASKGLEFRVEQSCADLAVHSDRLLLGRMLRNLVENAIRYTERGFVQVICAPAEGGVRIQVQDSGIGIPAEQLARVFEEFHQVGNLERDRSQGLGLGLAIVKRLSGFRCKV